LTDTFTLQCTTTTSALAACANFMLYKQVSKSVSKIYRHAQNAKSKAYGGRCVGVKRLAGCTEFWGAGKVSEQLQNCRV